MDHIRDKLPMRNIITPQFIRYDHPWFALVLVNQTPKETFSGLTIPAGLEKNINQRL